MSNFELSVLFFLQLAVILAACRVVGWLARGLGQPQVVGEMIAGVLLGPSLFGLIAPELQARLFPKPSLTILFAISQVGLAIYMFLVGLEFRTHLFLGRLKSAVSVSVAGMVVPFALGAAIGLLLVKQGEFFSPKATGYEAALFLGAAMAITAFPMLARIIYERGLAGTSLGTLALAAGAIDDASAWCVLAVVLASFGESARIAVLAIGGGGLYALLVLTVGRRLFTLFTSLTERHGTVTNAMMASTLMIVMIGSWFTDWIGIYAVFGAFIMGIAMPRGKFASEILRKLEPMTTVFLLPLFFTYSGLNTRLDLVNTWALWGLTLLVLLAACIGKGVACWAAARLNGVENRESMAVGALMNARGLMELIILNIGLQRGIITPTLFTIMVIMAIVTTLMAAPLFELVYGRWWQQSGHRGRPTPIDG